VNRVVGTALTAAGGQASPLGEQVRTPGRDLRQLGYSPVRLGVSKVSTARMTAGGAGEPGDDDTILPGSHRTTLEHIF
jgi:hypothetical protein